MRSFPLAFMQWWAAGYLNWLSGTLGTASWFVVSSEGNTLSASMPLLERLPVVSGFTLASVEFANGSAAEPRFEETRAMAAESGAWTRGATLKVSLSHAMMQATARRYQRRSFLLQQWQLSKCSQLIAAAEQDKYFKFDYVLRMRPDTVVSWHSLVQTGEADACARPEHRQSPRCSSEWPASDARGHRLDCLFSSQSVGETRGCLQELQRLAHRAQEQCADALAAGVLLERGDWFAAGSRDATLAAMSRWRREPPPARAPPAPAAAPSPHRGRSSGACDLAVDLLRVHEGAEDSARDARELPREREERDGGLEQTDHGLAISMPYVLEKLHFARQHNSVLRRVDEIEGARRLIGWMSPLKLFESCLGARLDARSVATFSTVGDCDGAACAHKSPQDALAVGIVHDTAQHADGWLLDYNRSRLADIVQTVADITQDASGCVRA
jgi:hypothetical protein